MAHGLGISPATYQAYLPRRAWVPLTPDPQKVPQKRLKSQGNNRNSGTGDSQRDSRESRESFAIDTPMFIARQADSHESREFPIRANHATKTMRISSVFLTFWNLGRTFGGLGSAGPKLNIFETFQGFGVLGSVDSGGDPKLMGPQTLFYWPLCRQVLARIIQGSALWANTDLNL